jgi:oligoribonuclease (3'-5' exoribonuclease)
VSFDRTFLRRHMSELCRLWTHQHLDTTSLRIAAEHWTEAGLSVAEKAVRAAAGGQHRAIQDLMWSIACAKLVRAGMRGDGWLR